MRQIVPISPKTLCGITPRHSRGRTKPPNGAICTIERLEGAWNRRNKRREMRATKSGELAKGHYLDSRQRESSINQLLLAESGDSPVPLSRTNSATMRAIFEFSAENAKTGDCLAERGGFEPPRDFHPCRFSRPVPSATRPPLRLRNNGDPDAGRPSSTLPIFNDCAIFLGSARHLLRLFAKAIRSFGELTGSRRQEDWGRAVASGGITGLTATLPIGRRAW